MHRHPKGAELLKWKRNPLIAHGSKAELLLGIHHICHRQVHHRDRGMTDEMFGCQQGAHFPPNQTPLLHRSWLWQLHLVKEIHCLLLDLLPLHDSFLSSLCSTTTLPTAVPFHSNRQVLPGIPELLQGELMAIDPQQCEQGPGLDFLLPANPDTAIGRRRFVGKEATLQVGPIWAQTQPPMVLKLLISVHVELQEVGTLICGVCATFQGLRSIP